jgi:hypothetical protein
MNMSFSARVLQEFYIHKQGSSILQCCRGSLLDSLLSISEIQSKAYVLWKVDSGAVERLPWTATYHEYDDENICQEYFPFSLSKTSVWVDFSLRVSSRFKEEKPEIDIGTVALFTQALVASMTSWNYVS